jgi:hypothetical protein
MIAIGLCIVIDVVFAIRSALLAVYSIANVLVALCLKFQAFGRSSHTHNGVSDSAPTQTAGVQRVQVCFAPGSHASADNSRKSAAIGTSSWQPCVVLTVAIGAGGGGWCSALDGEQIKANQQQNSIGLRLFVTLPVQAASRWR